MKLLFFGTPQEAVPSLEACARDHEVLTVVTRTDRPSGRGLTMLPPPVKTCAQKLGIPVLQPDKPLEVLDELRRLKADLAVVVAYGKILSKEVLESTRLGFLNVHFSLLPKYRGAAPIEWSLIQGETRTGVTVFWLDQGMDTGPIQAAREISIGIEEDAASLRKTLIDLGVETLRDSLEKISHGKIVRSPQSGNPSRAPKLTREDAWVDFERPALDLHNRVRGLVGGPRVFIRLLSNKSSVTLVRTSLSPSPANEIEQGTPPSFPRKRESNSLDPRFRGGDKGDSSEIFATPGTILSIERERGILIQCCPGQIWVVVVQPEGKRQIPAADFVNGLRLKPGDRLAYVPHG